jgi:hypothetical protein
LFEIKLLEASNRLVVLRLKGLIMMYVKEATNNMLSGKETVLEEANNMMLLSGKVTVLEEATNNMLSGKVTVLEEATNNMLSGKVTVDNSMLSGTVMTMLRG